VLTPADVKYQTVTWGISGDNTVGATISKDGVLKALTEGSVTISASVPSGSESVSTTKTIAVKNVEATGIAVTDISGVVGQPVALTHTLTPSNASNTNIVYELTQNTIGASLAGSTVTCNALGQVKYRAKIGSIVSNEGTINFTLDPANGETVTSAQQLDAIRSNLSGKFQLGGNIDLSSFANWTPIGTASAPFKGTLIGNGYTVSNLKMSSLNTTGLALFGDINADAKITGLKVNANIVGSNAAGIAANSAGTITDCEVSGSIGKANADYIGGIVSKQNGGNISNNTNKATIVGGSYVGGIAGYVQSKNANNKIENCVNSETVSGVSNVGGIVGYLGGDGCTVVANVNDASVTGSGENVGGIAGYAKGYANTSSYWVAFASCTNNANVNGGNNAKTGGILGAMGNYVQPESNCTNNGIINNGNGHPLLP
jgi:hypothetical protein